MSIEYVLDILERLEAAEAVTVDWDVVEEELEVLGLCREDDADCLDEPTE